MLSTEARLRQIIPSEMSIILKTSLHVNMLTSIDVKFIFDSASLSAGLGDKRVVQFCKYSPYRSCHPSSCLPVVCAMFLAKISPISAL